MSSEGRNRRPWAAVLVLWALLTAAGVVLAVLLPGHVLPVPASSTGTDVRRSLVLFGVLAAPLVAAVVSTAVVSLWSRRHRGDPDVPPADVPDDTPLDGAGRRASVLWITASSVLAAVLAVWGLALVHAEGATPPTPLRIVVTGHQWLWTFAYPGTHVNSRVLELPLGRPVEFDVTSVDVTHGFHPVQLGSQVDAVPGETTVLRVTPDRLGPFRVECTQLCGLYHSLMVSTGVVVPPGGFARWLESQGAPATVAHRLAEGPA